MTHDDDDGAVFHTGDKCETLKSRLCVTPARMPARIAAALMPPLFSRGQRTRVYGDLIGPALAVLLLASILKYGQGQQDPMAPPPALAPSSALLAYCVAMPTACYALARLGRSSIGLVELTSMLGYALYGHVLTLAASLVFYDERSDRFFFACLAFFGGLSSLRLVLVLVSCTPKPAARFVVCSFVCIVHLLFLIYLHFAYMHRTFVYGAGERGKPRV